MAVEYLARVTDRAYRTRGAAAYDESDISCIVDINRCFLGLSDTYLSLFYVTIISMDIESLSSLIHAVL